VWKVVEKVNDRHFMEIRKFEDEKFEEKMYDGKSINHPDLQPLLGYSIFKGRQL